MGRCKTHPTVEEIEAALAGSTFVDIRIALPLCVDLMRRGSSPSRDEYFLRGFMSRHTEVWCLGQLGSEISRHARNAGLIEVVGRVGRPRRGSQSVQRGYPRIVELLFIRATVIIMIVVVVIYGIVSRNTYPERSAIPS